MTTPTHWRVQYPPNDDPEHYVARQFTDDGEPTGRTVICEQLGTLQALFQSRGLHRLNTSDPETNSISELWL